MREQDAIVRRCNAVINDHRASQRSGSGDHVDVVLTAVVLTWAHHGHLFVCQYLVLDQSRAAYVRGRVLACT